MKLIPNQHILLATLSVASLGIGFASPAHAATASFQQDGAQSGSQDSSASVGGNWTLSFTAPNGDAKQATLAIKQSGTQLSGSFQGQRGNAQLTGTMQGSQVSIIIKAHGREIDLTGTLDGDKMSGTAGDGKPWSATRQ